MSGERPQQARTTAHAGAVGNPDYGLVYLITNIVNGKQYVGQTTSGLDKRWKRHCWSCTSKSNMPIALAIQKYGKENFTIEILERCASQEELDKAEISHARRFDCFSPKGYNLRAGSGPGAMSDETKRKIGKALRGRVISQGHRDALSRAHTGRPLAESAKQKLSRLYKGRKLPDEAYRNSRKAQMKTFFLIDPSGGQVMVQNMKEHCERHGLSRFKMSEVVNGKRQQHKGWMAGDPG